MICCSSARAGRNSSIFARSPREKGCFAINASAAFMRPARVPQRFAQRSSCRIETPPILMSKLICAVFSQNQLVPDTMHRNQVLRIFRKVFELFPELNDHLVESARRAVIVLAPNLIEEP